MENHFEQVHSIINLHRSRALQVVNNESLFICWTVGQYVSEKLKTSDYGSKVVTQLSEYLRTKDPSLRGYSRRNIYNMVAFFESYSSAQFLQLLSSSQRNIEFVQIETAQSYPADHQTDAIMQTNSAQLVSELKIPKFLLGINWYAY